jgi:hypothetical protein
MRTEKRTVREVIKSTHITVVLKPLELYYLNSVDNMADHLLLMAFGLSF